MQDGLHAPGSPDELGMVCMRLETSKEATLPNWHFCLVTHGDLLAAVRKVVSATKEGTYRDYDLERFKNGYFLETPEGIKTPFADTALSLERRHPYFVVPVVVCGCWR